MKILYHWNDEKKKKTKKTPQSAAHVIFLIWNRNCNICNIYIVCTLRTERHLMFPYIARLEWELRSLPHKIFKHIKQYPILHGTITDRNTYMKNKMLNTKKINCTLILFLLVSRTGHVWSWNSTWLLSTTIIHSFQIRPTIRLSPWSNGNNITTTKFSCLLTLYKNSDDDQLMIFVANKIISLIWNPLRSLSISCSLPKYWPTIVCKSLYWLVNHGSK